MSSAPVYAAPTPAATSHQPAAVPPPNEFERFLAAMPETFRDECRRKLVGTGLSPDLPVFTVLADLFEKHTAPAEEQTIPDFLEEARLHAERSRQLLDAFDKIPIAMLAKIDSLIKPLLTALATPTQQLQATATHLQRNVEALPILLLARRQTLPENPPQGMWARLQWGAAKCFRTLQILLSDHQAWLVTGSIAFCAAISLTVLAITGLSRAYEESYQQRLAHLEADSAENTIALNRLLTAGINLKVERASDNASYFLILQGAHKAAQPVDSPEGLAVQVWP